MSRCSGTDREYVYVYVPGKLSVHGKKDIMDILRFEKALESLAKQFKPAKVRIFLFLCVLILDKLSPKMLFSLMNFVFLFLELQIIQILFTYIFFDSSKKVTGDVK